MGSSAGLGSDSGRKDFIAQRARERKAFLEKKVLMQHLNDSCRFECGSGTFGAPSGNFDDDSAHCSTAPQTDFSARSFFEGLDAFASSGSPIGRVAREIMNIVRRGSLGRAGGFFWLICSNV